MIYEIAKSIITDEIVFIPQCSIIETWIFIDVLESCGFTNFYTAPFGQLDNAIAFYDTN